MKWFISCVVIIFLGTGLLIGMSSGVVIYMTDEKLTEIHKTNLMIVYHIDMEEE